MNRQNMERVQKIWQHPLYQKTFRQLQELEQDRIFCNHTLEHFLDVARLAWIETLERGVILEKSVVYAAALLHDLGRVQELTEGIPHQEAGAVLAAGILQDCGFSEEETDMIREAILAHRGLAAEPGTLAEYLYRADKKSRNCFACAASAACKWSEEKKNRYIEG